MDKKVKTGRPPKDAADKRDQRFNLRYTLAEIEHLRAQAYAAGLDPHEYARRRTLGHTVAPASARLADPALISELNRLGVNVNQLARAVHRGSAFTGAWQELGEQVEAALRKVLLAHGS